MLEFKLTRKLKIFTIIIIQDYWKCEFFIFKILFRLYVYRFLEKKTPKKY